MDLRKLGGLVAEYAPLLGTAIGGPAGGAIGGLISVVANTFGLKGKDASNPAKIMKAIRADPEAAIKLQKIQNDHEEALARINLESDEAYLRDRQSARSREVEMTKATGKRDINLYILAWVVVLGFLGLCAILIFRPLPVGTSQNILFMLFGGMISAFSAVMQYFFGSSKGSQEKTNLIAMQGLPKG